MTIIGEINNLAMSSDSEKVEYLIMRIQTLYGDDPKDLERLSWMVVHEDLHGVMPSEYDIREVNERLYLQVLSKAKEVFNKEKNSLT